MLNIYGAVTNALESLGYPIDEQGSYSNGERLPETFITYQILGSPNNSYADNLPTSTTWRVQIALYSNHPTIIQSADQTIKNKMLSAGFSRVTGRGIPFDKETNRYGYAIDYTRYEMEE